MGRKENKEDRRNRRGRLEEEGERKTNGKERAYNETGKQSGRATPYSVQEDKQGMD